MQLLFCRVGAGVVQELRMMSGYLAIVSVHMEWHLLTRMEHRVVTACEHSLIYVLVGFEWCLGQH